MYLLCCRKPIRKNLRGRTLPPPNCKRRSTSEAANLVATVHRTLGRSPTSRLFRKMDRHLHILQTFFLSFFLFACFSFFLFPFFFILFFLSFFLISFLFFILLKTAESCSHPKRLYGFRRWRNDQVRLRRWWSRWRCCSWRCRGSCSPSNELSNLPEIDLNLILFTICEWH